VATPPALRPRAGRAEDVDLVRGRDCRQRGGVDLLQRPDVRDEAPRARAAVPTKSMGADRLEVSHQYAERLLRLQREWLDEAEAVLSGARSRWSPSRS
jgi:hypothetical protein